MPKGRGSNERRRGPRQKTARRIARLPKSDPRALFHDTMKQIRMWGKRNPLNFAVELDREPHTWKLSETRNNKRAKRAKKERDDNARRRQKNWR